jgi:hypothetical protein
VPISGEGAQPPGQLVRSEEDLVGGHGGQFLLELAVELRSR